MLGLSPTELLILSAGAALSLALILATRRFPRAGITAWFLVLAIVPIWCGVSIIFYFQPGTIAGVLVLAGLIQTFPRTFGLMDLVMAYFFVLCLVPVLLGRGSLSTAFGAVSLWLVAFLVGRVAPEVVPVRWIYSCVAVIFTAVAVMAMIEFFADIHLFEHFGPANRLHAVWGPIQERGGIARAEGAFGHSIALGASTAAAIPLAAGSTFRTPVRLAMILVLLGGIVVTFSRVSMLCGILGVVLLVVFGGESLNRAARLTITVLLAVVGLAAFPLIYGVLQRASTEATRSSDYRTRLIGLIPTIDPVGRSSAMNVSPTGTAYFGGFQSIDSQILFTGLIYGGLALLLGLVALGAAVAKMLSGHAAPPTLAIVAQIPALAVVALITQYSMWFWFIAGLAVATSRTRSPGEVETRSLAPVGRDR